MTSPKLASYLTSFSRPCGSPVDSWMKVVTLSLPAVVIILVLDRDGILACCTDGLVCIGVSQCGC